MSTTVKQMIEMLSTHPPNMEVVIDPYIDSNDINAGEIAFALIHGDKDSILNLCLREEQAESDRDDDEELKDKRIDYGFDTWEDPLDKRKCLMISYKFLNPDSK